MMRRFGYCCNSLRCFAQPGICSVLRRRNQVHDVRAAPAVCREPRGAPRMRFDDIAAEIAPAHAGDQFPPMCCPASRVNHQLAGARQVLDQRPDSAVALCPRVKRFVPPAWPEHIGQQTLIAPRAPGEHQHRLQSTNCEDAGQQRLSIISGQPNQSMEPAQWPDRIVPRCTDRHEKSTTSKFPCLRRCYLRCGARRPNVTNRWIASFAAIGEDRRAIPAALASRPRAGQAILHHSAASFVHDREILVKCFSVAEAFG
jgi:hypothetical protein